MLDLTSFDIAAVFLLSMPGWVVGMLKELGKVAGAFSRTTTLPTLYWWREIRNEVKI